MSCELEIWKPIPSYDDYEVSNFGQVRSYKKKWKDGNPKVMKPHMNKFGYMRILLRKNKKPRRFYVHCLVMEVFGGPRPEGLRTNHKDGDKANDRLCNLEYVTASQSAKRTFSGPGRKVRRGAEVGSAKLTENDVRKIRSMLNRGLSAPFIASNFAVCTQSITQIGRGESWKHVLPLIEPEDIPDEFVIAIDTREQKPFKFAKDIKTVSCGLQTGDYSVVGLENLVTVERKTLSDLFGSVGVERERFVRELERMAQMEYSVIAVEATWEDIVYKPPVFSKMKPKAVVASLLAWEQRYGVHVHAFGPRVLAARLTFRILERFWKDIKTKKEGK